MSWLDHLKSSSVADSAPMPPMGGASASLIGDSPEEMVQPIKVDTKEAIQKAMEAGLNPLLNSAKDDKNAKTDYADLYKTDKAAAIEAEKTKRELDESLHELKPGEPKLHPNDVTKEEKAIYLDKFMDIQLGNSDIKFDGKKNPGQYKQDAMHDIKAMMQTTSGRELVMKLADNTIDKVDDKGKVISKGKTHKKTTLSDTAPSGAEPAGQDKASTTPDWAVNSHNPKIGSDTTITYNPGEPIHNDAKEDWAVDVRSDVVLYHEMVHALNDTQGTNLSDGKIDPLKATKDTIIDGKSKKVDPDDIGQKLTELQAVGLQPNPLNVGESLYREERKQLTGTTAEIKNEYGHKLLADATMPDRLKYHWTKAT